MSVNIFAKSIQVFDEFRRNFELLAKTCKATYFTHMSAKCLWIFCKNSVNLIVCKMSVICLQKSATWNKLKLSLRNICNFSAKNEQHEINMKFLCNMSVFFSAKKSRRNLFKFYLNFACTHHSLIYKKIIHLPIKPVADIKTYNFSFFSSSSFWYQFWRKSIFRYWYN